MSSDIAAPPPRGTRPDLAARSSPIPWLASHADCGIIFSRYESVRDSVVSLGLLSLPAIGMSARLALRSATAPDHARVDALFSSADLSRPAGYRHFLSCQAAAHLPVERAIDAADLAAKPEDWPARRRGAELRADLLELGGDEIREQPFALAKDEAAVLGAVYVLEGSRLGGALLRKRVSPGLPTRFLSAGRPGAWRALVELLDRRLDTPAAIEAAVASARSVFLCFEAGARGRMEPA